MTLEEARVLLASCTCERLVDRTFGDEEIYWMSPDHEEIASGYFGRDSSSVTFRCSSLVDECSWEGEEARSLRGLGKAGTIEYNH